MLSFQDQYTMFQRMAQDTDTTVLAFAKLNINIGMHILENELGSFFMEDTRTGSTSSSSYVVQLPENFIRLKKFYVTVGTLQYPAEEVYDENLWRTYQAYTQNSKSNTLTKVFRRRDTLELYPAPSSANTWTLIYEAVQPDLQYDDYSLGTITTLANGGTAVTGSSTLWTSVSGNLIGRYLKINADNQWYEITAVGSATGLTLKKPYQGIAISAGSSTYTIGQLMRIPEPTQHIPVYFALWQYFESYKRNEKFGLLYKSQYEQYMQWAKSTYGKRYSGQYIPSQRYKAAAAGLNPNWFPENMH